MFRQWRDAADVKLRHVQQCPRDGRDSEVVLGHYRYQERCWDVSSQSSVSSPWLHTLRSARTCAYALDVSNAWQMSVYIPIRWQDAANVADVSDMAMSPDTGRILRLRRDILHVGKGAGIPHPTAVHHPHDLVNSDLPDMLRYHQISAYIQGIGKMPRISR